MPADRRATPPPETDMIDLTPTESDSMRELRRIGPLVQALFTVVFAVAACTVALVSMGPAPAPAPSPTGPAIAPQHLTAGQTAAQDGAFFPAVIQAADVKAEAQPPAR